MEIILEIVNCDVVLMMLDNRLIMMVMCLMNLMCLDALYVVVGFVGFVILRLDRFVDIGKVVFVYSFLVYVM